MSKNIKNTKMYLFFFAAGKGCACEDCVRQQLQQQQIQSQNQQTNGRSAGGTATSSVASTSCSSCSGTAVFCNGAPMQTIEEQIKYIDRIVKVNNIKYCIFTIYTYIQHIHYTCWQGVNQDQIQYSYRTNNNY